MTWWYEFCMLYFSNVKKNRWALSWCWTSLDKLFCASQHWSLLLAWFLFCLRVITIKPWLITSYKFRTKLVDGLLTLSMFPPVVLFCVPSGFEAWILLQFLSLINFMLGSFEPNSKRSQKTFRAHSWFGIVSFT